jgi:lysophospholipase L1-like esterase
MLADNIREFREVTLHQLSGHNSTDLVVLLAGTNDLAHYQSPGLAARMRDDLSRMVQTAQHDLRGPPQQVAARTLLLSIPDAGFTEPAYVGVRREVNDWLRDPARVDQWRVLDLESLIPFQAQASDAAAGRMWSDHLHFSQAGYDKIGELVFEQIRPILTDIVVPSTKR